MANKTLTRKDSSEPNSKRRFCTKRNCAPSHLPHGTLASSTSKGRLRRSLDKRRAQAQVPDNARNEWHAAREAELQPERPLG
jgi:hypothetical protein